MTKQEIQQTALIRARSSTSLANHLAVMVGFKDWGIPADEIEPTVNVLTYHAWRALGRQVRKGEKGVHVVTWVPVGGGKGDQEREEQDGERKPRRQSMRPRTASVFHVSQTDVVN